jgi:CRP-like cAMP-binding protein
MPLSLNLLFARLPRVEIARMQSVGESVELHFGEVLCEPGLAARHVYFPTRAFVSLVNPVDGRSGLDVGIAGREGMVGVQLLINLKISPFRARVQGAGSAWRIPAAAFLQEFSRCPVMQQRITRYLYVLMVQAACMAACSHFHSIDERLAHWMLLIEDRAGDESFHVTHETLASMLGVRRVGVTNAAHKLQRLGLIDYRRGDVTILDRKGLESLACGCYSANRRSYAVMLPGAPSK